MEKDLNFFKEKLENEKKTLIVEMTELGVYDHETKTWEPVAVHSPGKEEEADENDLADKFEDYDARSSKLGIFSTRLNDIEDALKKISSGKYGRCEVSGEPIEEARLKANPAARTCEKHMNN